MPIKPKIAGVCVSLFAALFIFVCACSKGGGSGSTSSGASALNTLTVAVSGLGSVTSSPAGIGGCGPSNPCSVNFSSGTQVTLTATAGRGYVFSGWSGSGCSGQGSCVVALNANQTVTALFSVSTSGYALSTLTVTVTGGNNLGAITSSPIGLSCPSGTCSLNFSAGPVTLTAAPNANDVFIGWGGACSGAGYGTTCTLALNSNKTVTAEFAACGPPHGTQTYFSSAYTGNAVYPTTYTFIIPYVGCPAVNMTIQAWGGGGGAGLGGCSNYFGNNCIQTSGGGGGGGGAYSTLTTSLSPSTYTVSVAAGVNSGASGQSSSFGVANGAILVLAPGGQFGQSGGASGGGVGGSGGGPGGIGVVTPGASGANGAISASFITADGGNGGAGGGPSSGSGGAGSGNCAVNGANGNAPGGGGGGGAWILPQCATSNPGYGAPGEVILTW